MEAELYQTLVKGIQAHKAGQFREADRLYTEILKVQPTHPDANHNMGMLAVEVGKAQEALPFFKVALEANSSIGQYWLSYINALITLERRSEAKAVFEQAQKNDVKGANFDSLEKQFFQRTPIIIGPEKDQETKDQNINILDTLKPDKAHNLARQKIKQGLLEDAINIYQDILARFPKNKRAQDGVRALSGKASLKRINLKDPPQSLFDPLIKMLQKGQYQEVLNGTSKLLLKFPNSIGLYNLNGTTHKALGQIDYAIERYQKAISIQPAHPNTYFNMANAYNARQDLNSAIHYYKKALKYKPDYIKAYINLGIAQNNNGDLSSAMATYEKALKIDPHNVRLINNLGITYKQKGYKKSAIEKFTAAIKLKTNFVEAHNNLGNCLKEVGNLQEAMSSFQMAIKIKPDYAEAYNNLGNTFKELKKFKDARKSYNQAIKIKPGFYQTHANIGSLHLIEGDLESAINSFQKSIELMPSYIIPWNNIFLPLKALGQRMLSEKSLNLQNVDTPKSLYFKISLSILNFRLGLGTTKAAEAMSIVQKEISKAQNRHVYNPEKLQPPISPKPFLPSNITTLVHFGRSGTGLLHSLLDNHPEIMGLPSIYFSEFFSQSTWEELTTSGWEGLADRFINKYEILFDASINSLTLAKGGHLISNLGQAEGMTKVGARRNEVIKINKKLFRKELIQLMGVYDKLSAFSFFKLIHSAYHKCLSDKNNKKLIFYHIHNPSVYAELNFLQFAPDTNYIVMLREPLQSLESWLRIEFIENDYNSIVVKIAAMLLEIENHTGLV